jgi:hypothetical protein
MDILQHPIKSAPELLILFVPAVLTILLPEILWGYIMFQASWKRLIIPYAVLMLALNFAGQALIWKKLIATYPSDFIVCGSIPLAALIAFNISIIALKKLKIRFPGETPRHNWFLFGTLVIVSLPVIVGILVVLFSNSLCKAGLIVCSRS